MNTSKATDHHVIQHIEFMVEAHPVIEDGIIYSPPRWGRSLPMTDGELYIDKHGLLKTVPHGNRAKGGDLHAEQYGKYTLSEQVNNGFVWVDPASANQYYAEAAWCRINRPEGTLFKLMYIAKDRKASSVIPGYRVAEVPEPRPMTATEINRYYIKMGDIRRRLHAS